MSSVYSRVLIVVAFLFPSGVFASESTAEELLGFIGYSTWGVPKENVDIPVLSAKVASIVTDDRETRQKVANHFAQWFNQRSGMAVEVKEASKIDIKYAALGNATYGRFKGPTFVVNDLSGGDRKPIGNFYLLELSERTDEPRVVDVIYANEAMSYAQWMAYELYFSRNPSKALLQRFVRSAEVTDKDWAIFQSIWEHHSRDEWKEVMAGFDMLTPPVRMSPLMLGLKYKLLANIEIDKPGVGARNFRIKQSHYASTAKTVEKVYGHTVFGALRTLPWYYEQDKYQKMSKALSIVENNLGLSESIIRYQADTFSELGDHKAAVRYAKLRVEQYPDSHAYASLVEILERAENYEQALKYAKERLDKYHTEIAYRGLIESLLGLKDYNQALEYAEAFANEFEGRESTTYLAATHSSLGNNRQVKALRNQLIDEHGMAPFEIDILIALTSKNFKKFVKILEENKDSISLTPDDMEGQKLFEDFLKSREYRKWAKQFG